MKTKYIINFIGIVLISCKLFQFHHEIIFSEYSGSPFDDIYRIVLFFFFDIISVILFYFHKLRFNYFKYIAYFVILYSVIILIIHREYYFISGSFLDYRNTKYLFPPHRSTIIYLIISNIILIAILHSISKFKYNKKPRQ